MSAIDFSDPATIAFLTDALTAAGVAGLEISAPSGQLRIVVSSAGEAKIGSNRSAQPGSVSPVLVRAPLAGYFCVAHRSGSAEVSSLPRAICATDVLGFIRVGPVLLPVSAGRSGTVTKLLAEADAMVGYGAPLFEIEVQS